MTIQFMVIDRKHYMYIYTNYDDNSRSNTDMACFLTFN